MNQETLPHAEAIAHLQQTEPVLGHIIARCGPCILQPRELELLVMLCRSIIYWQLSDKAAVATIDKCQGPAGKLVFRARVRRKGTPPQTATF